MTAPIPGVISQVKVQAGQAVKAREVLMLLEAMKMQNEILAPHPGTVREVYVSNGSAVNTGDRLVAIDPE
jgi:biotin carboxyl carrier protein